MVGSFNSQIYSSISYLSAIIVAFVNLEAVLSRTDRRRVYFGKWRFCAVSIVAAEGEGITNSPEIITTSRLRCIRFAGLTHVFKPQRCAFKTHSSACIIVVFISQLEVGVPQRRCLCCTYSASFAPLSSSSSSLCWAVLAARRTGDAAPSLRTSDVSSKD